MKLATIFRYFFPRERLWRLPNHIISEYDIHRATEDETIIMLAGRARSPEQARNLLNKYNCRYAYELLPLLPPRRKRVSAAQRLTNVIMKIEGAIKKNPYRKRTRAARIPVRYKYD